MQKHILAEQLRAWAELIEKRNTRGVPAGMRQVASDLEQQAQEESDTRLRWRVDDVSFTDTQIAVDCPLGSVMLTWNEDGISADIFPLFIADGPAASCWAAVGDLTHGTEE